MAQKKLVGFTGSFNRPSKTWALANYIRDMAVHRYDFHSALYDMQDVGGSLGAAQKYSELAPQARFIAESIAGADALIIAAPVYKGSYPGLFKHFFDLLAPDILEGKPVILAATGGGDRHALVVEHQLRPLFGFFRAHSLATAVYASARDFSEDHAVISPELAGRVAEVAGQLAPFFTPRESFPVQAGEKPVAVACASVLAE